MAIGFCRVIFNRIRLPAAYFGCYLCAYQPNVKHRIELFPLPTGTTILILFEICNNSYSFGAKFHACILYASEAFICKAWKGTAIVTLETGYELLYNREIYSLRDII